VRLDYLTCTGDSSYLPVKKLIRWKHRVDSVTGRPDYPALAKKYRRKTGRSAVSDRPLRRGILEDAADSIKRSNQARADALRLQRKRRKRNRSRSGRRFQKFKRPAVPHCRHSVRRPRPRSSGASGTADWANQRTKDHTCAATMSTSGETSYVGAFFPGQRGEIL